MEEFPGEDSAQSRPTFVSGLLGNKDSEERPPASSPSQAERRDPPASRQSFRLAMGNPSDFFVDVM